VGLASRPSRSPLLDGFEDAFTSLLSLSGRRYARGDRLARSGTLNSIGKLSLVHEASLENGMTGLHDSLTVVDGLVISKWSRAVFADMRKGGLTAANCTCSIWEGFADTMHNIALWKRWFTDHADLITPVRATTDIHHAKAEGKTGIILGFQNTSALEDQVGYIPLFKELGVGVMQITYNTQNLAGSGCYERHDGGLSGFGYEVTSE
jgi:membrane dipeptidase